LEVKKEPVTDDTVKNRINGTENIEIKPSPLNPQFGSWKL
jgi:hypothetical protein